MRIDYAGYESAKWREALLMSYQSDLELIKKYQREIRLMGGVLSLLNWDQETNMPSMGVKTRSEKMAYFAGLLHEKRLSNEFFDAVQRLKKLKISEDDKIMVDILNRDLIKARKLPREFVEEIARVTTLANSSWKEAREKKDFSLFKEDLKKIVELKRKEAMLIGLPGNIYNSLLDDYEEGMSVEELTPKFEELKRGIIELLRKIENTEEYKEQKELLVSRNFSKEFQIELAREVVRRMGLKEGFSRIDFAEHPFSTTIGIGDVRITTNVRDDPLFSFNSSMHEAGHALYEFNMPEEHFYDVIGHEPSLGIHESQSKFWENMIGLNKSFWKFYFPKFDKLFKLDENFDQWYKEVNIVEPGKVRVAADEVHYCLHIILRFEL